MASPFLKIFGEVGSFARSQISTDKATRKRKVDADITRGQLISNVDLTSGSPKKIPHSIGQLPAGVLLLGQSDFASIRVNSLTTSLLELESDANVNVSLWVF